MSRKKTKTYAVLMALTLLLGILAGCGGSSNGNSAANKPATNSPNNTSSSEPGAEDEDLSPITLSIFVSDPNPNWNNMQDDISKVITEKTGVTLNAEFAVGDPQQKIALIAAGGEYPDMISAKGEIGKLVDAGAVIDLTDLIEEHAPNIKRVLGENLARA